MADQLSEAVAQRVALLARPGKAADNLADALRQAGADLVLVADPNTLDEAALLAAKPQAVLVALEPGVEQAIDRLDAVLSSPRLTVIFDEADLAAHRAGWDAARWIRHLSAKLNHHQHVLPPGGEAETIDWHPSPGQLPKSANEFGELDFGAFAQEAAGRADAVPANSMHFETATHEVADVAHAPVEPSSPPPAQEVALPPDFASAPSAEAVMETQIEDELSFDALALSEISPDAPMFDATAFDAPAFDEPAFDAPSIDTSNAESAIELSSLEEIRLAEDDDASIADTASVQPMQFDDDAFFLEELSADASAAEALDASSTFAFEGEPRFDDASSSHAARADHFDLDLSDLPSNENIGDLTIDEASPPPVASAAGASGVSNNSFGELSLASGDEPTAVPPELRSGAFSHDLSALEARISGLSLVALETDEAAQALPADDAAQALSDEASLPPIWEETPLQPTDTTTAVPVSNMASNIAASAASFRGVVLIEAGLGGPDPVRQVLAGLPSNFPVPVLVRLHLQGGRYDRLVTQMERAASLPVVLAEVGDLLRAGCIYFLPEGVGLHALTDGMEFIAHPSPAATIFAALPAEDSAILFLSGSDATLIEDAMQAADAGALVAAQSPEDCYDGAACAYLASRGAASGLPADLARRLLSHWTS